MSKIQSFCRLCQRVAKGQSLVETAIVAPILIFMLIGVFEVGWALRGYLVLVNISRETTRFSIRPGYLNYTFRPPASLTVAQQKEWAGTNVGYNNVINQMFNSMSSQLNKTTTLSPALVISHLVIDTKYPCDPTTPIANCNCSKFDKNDASYDASYGFTYDDLILHPKSPGYENFYLFTYDPSPTDTITYTSVFSYASQADDLAAANNKFNCELLKRTPSAVPSPNYVIETEMFYRQPQLMGFPLIANPFTNPVPMYAHTTMRMIASRSSNDLDKVGPACEAYPFAVDSGALPALNGNLNIFGFGWLKWNPGVAASEGYLVNELKNPRMALNDFTDSGGPSSDKTLNMGDRVAKIGTTYNTTNMTTALNALLTKKIRVPIGSNSSGTYTVSGFVWVSIYGFTLPNIVNAVYLGPANVDENGATICPASD